MTEMFRFSPEIITVVDNENHRCSWEYLNSRKFPRLFFVIRWQALSEADGMTEYETIEIFGGILTYFPGFLKSNFRVSAKALKSYCKQIMQYHTRRIAVNKLEF
jgi:hypothetical protein